jgi:hypothetical protein
MKKVHYGVLAVVILIFISCVKNVLPSTNFESEPLSIFWEKTIISMNIGEIKELKWESNQIIRPRVSSTGSSVVITGMTDKGVHLMAIESGIDVVSLFIDDKEIICMVTVLEDDYHIEEQDEESLDDISVKIIIPYTKKFLSIGQETRITVFLENGEHEDDLNFTFLREYGKNCIAIEGISNIATVKAIGEGIQYLVVSHPKSSESKIIVYDVLPPAPPPPPVIDVSESPIIVRKGETKNLNVMLLNGKKEDMEKFQFQVVENAYAIEVTQIRNTLNVTGIAPGVGKIKIRNPAALRDYDVMVIVD